MEVVVSTFDKARKFLGDQVGRVTVASAETETTKLAGGRERLRREHLVQQDAKFAAPTFIPDGRVRVLKDRKGPLGKLTPRGREIDGRVRSVEDAQKTEVVFESKVKEDSGLTPRQQSLRSPYRTKEEQVEDGVMLNPDGMIDGMVDKAVREGRCADTIQARRTEWLKLEAWALRKSDEYQEAERHYAESIRTYGGESNYQTSFDQGYEVRPEPESHLDAEAPTERESFTTDGMTDDGAREFFTMMQLGQDHLEAMGLGARCDSIEKKGEVFIATPTQREGDIVSQAQGAWLLKEIDNRIGQLREYPEVARQEQITFKDYIRPAGMVEQAEKRRRMTPRDKKQTGTPTRVEPTWQEKRILFTQRWVEPSPVGKEG